jgi:hypothetical protein
MHEKTGHDNKDLASDFRLEVAFQFYSVQWFHPRNYKTKKNSAPRGKFRMVENGLNEECRKAFQCFKRRNID